MVMALFTDPIVYASNNGYWSEPIYPTRGCRQGCMYSPSIFTATVEALGLGIRQNSKIVGIRIGDSLIKSGQFADDLWTVTPPSQANINEILMELQNFGEFSGLFINPEKCSVLQLGPFKDSDAKYYTLRQLYWSPGPIKILGYEIATDIQTTYRENYTKLLEKADSIINSWENRSLTPIGKITVVNSLINTLFAHKLLALPTPPQVLFSRSLNVRSITLSGEKKSHIKWHITNLFRSMKIWDYNLLI